MSEGNYDPVKTKDEIVKIFKEEKMDVKCFWNRSSPILHFEKYPMQEKIIVFYCPTKRRMAVILVLMNILAWDGSESYKFVRASITNCK